jgi:Holliday junction resolvasome RuvABC endonuclease subunit
MWGVDLGVRSLYVAHISDVGLSLHSKSLKIRQHTRGEELSILQDWLADTLGPGEVWIEEPPLAGSRNLQTYLHLSQTSGIAAATAGARANLVPVSSWKKGTVGNGSASKELVANWLRAGFPAWHGTCQGDQNYIDATCIAIYGYVAVGGTIHALRRSMGAD